MKRSFGGEWLELCQAGEKRRRVGSYARLKGLKEEVGMENKP